MLEIIELECKRNDRRLFTGLNLHVPLGTMLHVRGRNGSGKTTLLRAICGLLTPNHGKICWRGESIRTLNEDYQKEILYVGHRNGIKGDLTGIENLKIATTLAGIKTDIKAIKQALAQLELADLSDLPTRLLSQGQKKRVALARLFLNQALLWILDEPFVTLDTDTVTRIINLIENHLKNNGLVVLTTHQIIPFQTNNILSINLSD